MWLYKFKFHIEFHACSSHITSATAGGVAADSNVTNTKIGRFKIPKILRKFMIWFDIFVNWNWIYTQWQQYSTVQYSTVQYTFKHKEYIEQNK
jgi:hypothetical protein